MKNIFLIFSGLLCLFFMNSIFAMDNNSNSSDSELNEDFFNFEDEVGQVSFHDFKQTLEVVKIFINSLDDSVEKANAILAIQAFERHEKTKKELLKILKENLKKVKIKKVSPDDEDEPFYLCPCSIL